MSTESCQGSEIAPYALVRLATVTHPSAPAAAVPFRDAMNALADKEAEAAAIARDLVTLLHDSAGTHSAAFHQQIVLPLRRDVHNGRPPRPAMLAALGTLPDRIPLLATWLVAQRDLADRVDDVLQHWPRALAAERSTLAKLCAAEPLSKACVLSGRDLRHGLDRTARGAGEPDRRARKAEPSVLRFALRATAKTSPFSWYTAVGWGRWSREEREGPIDAATTAHVRVNHVLVSRLVTALLRDPARRDRLPHRLAPAVEERDGRVRFHRDAPVDAARAYLAIEESIDIAASPPLRFLIDAAASASPKGISPAELTSLLAVRLPNDQAGHATRYVGQLLEAGLLIPVAPIDPQEPDAAGALAAWLREQAEPGSVELADRLATLTRRTAAFTTLDTGARAARLVELEESWRGIGEATGANLTGAPPLHEDVVLPATIQLGPGHGRDAAASLARLTPLLMMFDRQLLIRRLTRDRFVARFGAGGSARPADCAELLRSALVAGLTVTKGAASKEIDDLLAVRARLATMARSANAGGAVDRDIPDTVVDAAADLLPGWMTTRPVSYSFFVQPITGGGLVVNHIYAGFGRFASRFLDWLPPDARTTVTEALDRVADSLPLTQFRPVAGFNPNLHPMITGQEVGEDPRWADLTPDQLDVHHDTERDEIRLRRRDSGEPVDVLYLGYLMPLALPDRVATLYADLACGWIDLTELRSTSEYASIVKKGRLRHRDVVLERRCWEFDGDRLRAELTGDEAATALAAARLRGRHDLPDQVFVGAGGAVTSRADFEARLGAPKPQYIDFANALHLRCLRRLLSRYDSPIQVTEALPVPGGRVVELITESYRRAS